MAHLAISCFGAFQVMLDGRPVSGFTSKKAQALLAYLVVERRSHNREELAGLLWPDYPEASARTNLRNALANVRRVIGDREATPSYLIITRQTIQFNPANDSDLDVAIFDQFSASAPYEPEMVHQLEEAVARVQGPFLAGFSLADSPAFEEWLLLKREYFGRQIGQALKQLTHHYAQENAYGQALHYARRWVTLDPWQEEAHRQVMHLLTRSGERSAALAHYAACRRALITELGVEPSHETTQLFAQIRDGAIDGQVTGEPVVAAKQTFPRPLTPLIGREQALTDLARLLTDPTVRLVTVVGPGGIGKTHLALEAAAAQQLRFQHGVVLVALAPLESAAEIISAMAKALHFSFYEDTPPEQQILDYLRAKQMLLVMDNFEHLLEGAKFVTTLLETAPDLKVLATSRVRLQIQGEQLYPLAGLSYPDEAMSLATLADEEIRQHFGALTLFLNHARRLHPSYVLTSDAVADVARICRLVDGMPLGIVLAAAWSEMLTPGEIADEIAHSFTFLQANSPNSQGLPARHQNLEAVFTHTWSLLSARERRVFQQASIFRGGFTQEAAQAVVDAALPDLLALVSKFLLHRAADGRYTIHELLRQFAAQKLAQSPTDEQAARRRHSTFFCDFLHQREDDLKGAHQQRALKEIEAEGENVRVAWRWAVAHGEIAHLDRAINCLGLFYEWRGRYHDGETACRGAAESLDAPADGDALRIRAKILTWQARFSRLLGQSERAQRLVQQSLCLLNGPDLRDQNSQLERAATYLELGQQAVTKVEIQTWFKQSLALHRSLHNAWETAQVLSLLGASVVDIMNTYEGNSQFLEESLDLCRTLGDQRGIAQVLATQGFTKVLQGQAAQGETLLKQSLAICQETRDKTLLAGSMGLLGVGYLYGGKFEEAQRLYEEEMSIWQDFGNRARTASASAKLAEATLHLGHYAQARVYATSALQLAQAVDDSGRISYALWHLGFAVLGEGACLEAEQLLAESIAIHQRLGIRAREHDVLATFGFASLAAGKVNQAQQALRAVLEMALENRFFGTSVEGICLAACVSAVQEKPEQAVELYALARRYPYIANSCGFADAAGPHIAVAIELLPAEVVAAAQARGRALDRWATVAALVEQLVVAGK
ncbi:MAG: BTAD domain-containing putative transcriptional regulator [Caldilineaceae bacterium]